MTAGYALAIKRLYGAGIVRAAAKHNLREIAAEIGADGHIDPARIADNFILRGPSTAKEVAALAKSLMDAAGVLKCRKGAVTALELLFTLPAASNIDPRRYFEQATAWAEQYFGVPVLSCIGHLDEGSPHAHALLLPLVNGRMGGSDLHGGKAKLAAMQTSFHEAVGAPHGLPKYVPQKRLSAPVRAAAMALARETLQVNAALNDDIIDALLVPHTKDPAPLLLALGIAMPAPKPKAKDFVSIMTAVCKPEKQSPIGKPGHYPIGKEIHAAPNSSLPDTCVGEALATTPVPADEVHHQHLIAEQRQPQAGAQIRLHTPATPTASPAPTCNAAPDVQAQPSAHCSNTVPQAAPEHDAAQGGHPSGSADDARDVSKVGCISLPAASGTSAAQVHQQATQRAQQQVGHGDAPASASPEQPPAAQGNAPCDYQRQHDDDQRAELWDSERGEFAQATGPPGTAPNKRTRVEFGMPPF